MGVLATALCIAGPASAQVDSVLYRDHSPVPPVISFFAPFVPVKFVGDVVRLKEYVCGDELHTFRQRYGDVRAVDLLFVKALELSWDNVGEALLITFLATMDHRRFGLRLPVIGSLLWFPLTAEFPDEFHARVNALPGRLYPDSPHTAGSDRDKLQHFFGSAYLAYVCESTPAADRVGEFIEQGEDLFVVEGMLDERDSRANREGQLFGVLLLDDPDALPSRTLGRTALPDSTAGHKEDQ